MMATAEFPVTVVADESVGERAKGRALETVLQAARFAPRPVLHGRVTLFLLHDPSLERPAVAKATLDVSGRPVRAHVAAAEMIEAIDLLEERLRRNLEELGDRYRANRHETGIAVPGEWRHGSLPESRPEFFPRPVEEREVIRHKTFALPALSLEEAASELQVLDYDFHLFTNGETGEENVVHRHPDGTISVAQVTPHADRGDRPFAVDPLPPPTLPVDAARERLDVSGEPFLFFVNAGTGRGNVVYRRYDGHYGLIEPSA